jgi:hypothetical protein
MSVKPVLAFMTCTSTLVGKNDGLAVRLSTSLPLDV